MINSLTARRPGQVAAKLVHVITPLFWVLCLWYEGFM